MLRFLRNTRLYCTSVSGTNRTKPVTTKESKLNFKKLKYPTKVPINPVLQNFPIVDKSVIDNPTIQLLERLALVNLENKEALSTLESSIEFAEKITLIETTNVLPFYTVLEDQTLYLREDSVTEGNSRENILRGAKVTEEDYFVSPPGNIPLQQKDKDFSENSTEYPSKYFVEPYEFKAASNLAPSPGTQSITIKSKLPYATLDVESITVIPLHTASLDADFAQYLKINNKTRTIPSVIRSVIDLQAATGAVLFDSVDNERENTLLLNRKLAPFQCVVTCYHEGKQLKDLEDLCLHIQYILSRSGLRIMGENILFTNSLQELESEIFKCDNLGVPYLLIISESSLHNGLLKLRNRDTTLEETIHISDLPNYLLQIFS
ncbi:unnamed protein product [Ceratitis capitata]|uniref:Glutamyl-tRNA(Gln) amidotransferase subunit C, mitochondrial n=1 Tax=Ceratitis capitata TaxID=7213 RepID=A0A811UHT0_CERCA|nr:unnamed protein product [Ceratitis capitata]